MKKQTRTSRKTSTLSLEIPFNKLRWKCKPEDLGITSIENVDPSREIIGQDRAMRALRVGLEMKQVGYNIFVTGPTGTGRTTTIKRLLREYKAQPGTLTDKCYVHNFNNHDQPKLISLSAGKGASFKKDMLAFVGELRREYPPRLKAGVSRNAGRFCLSISRTGSEVC
jgi:ATP-dependent Lon protease